MRELGAETAKVERIHARVDFVGAFMGGYNAERARLAPARCDTCGVALAHYVGAGARGVVCPECNLDALAELEPLDLNAQLAALGREVAREAWAEHAADLDNVPVTPELRPLAHVAYLRDLLERDRPFDENERRIVVHAYRNGLQVLIAREASKSDGERR